MENWRRVWRDGLSPLLSREQLLALQEALQSDDQRLIQGLTTSPPPMMCVQDWPVEGGCVLGFCGAVANGGIGVATVKQVEEFFARLCYECDQAFGEPAACRYFLNWFDDTPRETVRQLMIWEVRDALGSRVAVAV